MTEELKITTPNVTAKQCRQSIRDVGASLLNLPAYIEHTVLNNGGNPREIVAITSNLRILCSALIKNDFDAIKNHCNELEIALIEAQKQRLINISDIKE